MKVLVIGGGGREHALAWRLAQSPRVQRVYVAPGNGGTAADPHLRNVPLTDILDLADFAASEAIDLTVVGPEAPLAQGVVDLFRSRGLSIFGPSKAAAQLESSKDFAKAFMKRHGIPTAAYETFSDPAAAHAYIRQRGAPIVVKADGLASGKGVVVAQTPEQAHDAVDAMLVDNRFGDSGARVVIEDFLDGEEASFIVMSDGRHALSLATSQDHKRLGNGDTGPNTGGMGAYSPAPIITAQLHARIMREIIMPTLRGMAQDGIPYTGFLYAGLMIDPQGNPKTLEFNCRLGDPETQPIMMRLKSDLVTLIEAAINGQLDQTHANWDRRTALGVVMASHGYPDAPRQGDIIEQLPPNSDECIIFHAGTVLENGTLKTAGGRVLCVTALGDTLKQAQQRAYASTANTRFAGAQYRTDIGHRALKSSPKAV